MVDTVLGSPQSSRPGSCSDATQEEILEIFIDALLETIRGRLDSGGAEAHCNCSSNAKRSMCLARTRRDFVAAIEIPIASAVSWTEHSPS